MKEYVVNSDTFTST